MEKKTDKYNLIRLRTVSAVFLVFIFLIPILTLLRMGLKHIPVGQYGENILGKYKLIGFNTAISEALSGFIILFNACDINTLISSIAISMHPPHTLLSQKLSIVCTP